jgi:hypothetical protein
MAYGVYFRTLAYAVRFYMLYIWRMAYAVICLCCDLSMLGNQAVPSRDNASNTCRTGQNRIYTPYMTVYLVISQPKILQKYRIYTAYIYGSGQP